MEKKNIEWTKPTPDPGQSLSVKNSEHPLPNWDQPTPNLDLDNKEEEWKPVKLPKHIEELLERGATHGNLFVRYYYVDDEDHNNRGVDSCILEQQKPPRTQKALHALETRLSDRLYKKQRTRWQIVVVDWREL